MKEIIFSILCVGGLLIPSSIFKQWWLFSVFVAFFVCFGLIEWLAFAKTGHTVSQHFWIFSDEHPIKGLIIIGFMLISWLSLLWHFGERIW
jgi:hypothetical protein